MPPGPIYCGVYGCRNNSKISPYLTFFQLPCDVERWKIWAELNGRQDVLQKETQKRCFVCSLHFTTVMLRNKRLKSYAMPSLSLPGAYSASASASDLHSAGHFDNQVDFVQDSRLEIQRNPTQSDEKETQTIERIVREYSTVSVAVQTELDSSFFIKQGNTNVNNNCMLRKLLEYTHRT